ncbi:solute carrier family 25 member 45, partial [Venturia canescens]|uniref:solute carrier family 25 member 45 n=1 Tax=Venturia canescens TaxID=32260 RepID=UPI001C9D5B44
VYKYKYISINGLGALGLAVGHPMDTVKTIQQMNNQSLSSVKIVARIMKSQGIRGFYKGMMFPLVSAGCLNSVFFGVYGNSLRVLQLSRGNDPGKIVPQDVTVYKDTFIAGCIAGVVQAVMACPSEFIKVRMQTGQGEKSYLEIYDQTSSFCDRDATASGLYVLVYLYARHHMHGHLELNPGTFETLIAGGLAESGTISWMPVVPFDTIKSRMQADDLRNPLYKGMVDCTIKLYKLGGTRIFFKGFVMIAIRSFPVNASAFLAYDMTMKCFKYFFAN